MNEHTLAAAAGTAVRDCLALKPGERFLVVSNPGTEQETIARALAEAASAAGASPELLLQPAKSQGDFAEDYVLDAIASGPEAFASISAEKLGKDRRLLASPLEAPDGRKYDHIFHYLLRGTRTLRAFWSPGVTADSFAKTVDLDYGWMRKAAAALAAVLDEAEGVLVRAPGGTDIAVGVSGRKAHVDDGDFGLPGLGGNLPAGEVFVSPALRTASGRIVFDGSLADIEGDYVLASPVECSVSGGYAIEVSGGAEARRLEAALRKGMELASGLSRRGRTPEEALRYATNARNLGELGIGLNPAARISGKMLEDEKVYGTCHFALGFNYDEDAPAMIHLDGLVKRPSVFALMPDGRELALLVDGRLAEGILPD